MTILLKMSYSSRFNILTVLLWAKRPLLNEKEEVVVDDDGNEVFEEYQKEYDVKDLHMINSDLYLTSLAILTDYEDKTANPNAKNTVFYRAYERLPNGFSLKRCAERIVDLYDQYGEADFAKEMFFSYKQWGRRSGRKADFKTKDGEIVKKPVSDTYDETCGYDPYVLSVPQQRTPLSRASFTLLAKHFRFVLEETLRHFFGKSDPNSWYPYTDARGKKVTPDAVYSGRRSSLPFSNAIGELLEIYDSVYKLSPHLNEFEAATARALEARDRDIAAREAERLAGVANKRSYGTTSRDKSERPAESKPLNGSSKKAAAAAPAVPVVPLQEKKPKSKKVTEVDADGWVTTTTKRLFQPVSASVDDEQAEHADATREVSQSEETV